MASSSQTGGDLAAQFKKFATKGEEATSKDITRWCTDAGVFKGSKTCTSNNLDIAFSAVKTKGKTTITVKQMGALIKSISKQYAKDHKMDVEAAEAKLTEMLSSASKEAHGATKQSKTGGVERMTDTSQYTGSHKERFDESGKGKGMEGRADISDNSGYVGNYKGAGTYDEKTK